MPEIAVSEEKCKGCGFCIVYCPKKILSFSEDFNAKGYHFPLCTDPDTCTGCAICGIMCPEVAIEVYK